jgi:hypothetical protein
MKAVGCRKEVQKRNTTFQVVLNLKDKVFISVP